MKSRVIISLSILAVMSAPLSVGGVDLSGRVRGIAVSDDAVWVAVNNAAVKIDKVSGERVNFPFDESNLTNGTCMTDVAILADNDVWFTCGNAGVGHYDGSAMTFTNPSGANSGASWDILAIDHSGSLWAAAAYGGMWKLTGDQWEKKYDCHASDVYSAYHNNGLAFDALGTLWWSANQTADSFGYCDAASGWVAINNFTDFTSSRTSMTIDEDGNKWIGIRGPQLVKYAANGDVSSVKLNVQIDDGVYNIPVYDLQTGPDGRVWAAVKQSLYAVTTDGVVTETAIPVPDDDNIVCFKHDGEAIWIGTVQHGLFKWENGGLQRVNLSAGVEAVTADSESADAAVYDIMGRKVDNPQPGNLYISNGKKFVK